ncbi:MAG TPA: YeeE/YedE thiosulfate transporter family protein [Bacteroidales bacterium]|nr:YeeE/YedE thiosulfate transporter family protein [Bacteroidales bacterium]
MGPLVTQGIIDPAWNNLIALLVGMAFGFVLESSGFSSSRKLAGVFYGYDFVVLKVFFTAAITAALGLLIMSSIGMIDLSKIFINPTFLGPGIVGGIIMGFGFIMGGYCPGTSFCGAAIGKIDAIVFTLGY